MQPFFSRAMPAARLLKTPQQILTLFSPFCPRKTQITLTGLNRVHKSASPGTLLGSRGPKLRQADRQFRCAFHSLPNKNVAKCDFKREIVTRLFAKIAHYIHCQVTSYSKYDLRNVFAEKQKISQVTQFLEKKIENTSCHSITKGLHRRQSEDSQKPEADVKAREFQIKIILKILLSFNPTNLQTSKPRCNCYQVCQPTAALEHLLPAKCQQLPLPAKTLGSFHPLHTLQLRDSGDQTVRVPRGPHHVSNTVCLSAGLYISYKCQRFLPVPCVSFATASNISWVCWNPCDKLYNIPPLFLIPTASQQWKPHLHSEQYVYEEQPLLLPLPDRQENPVHGWGGPQAVSKVAMGAQAFQKITLASQHYRFV